MHMSPSAFSFEEVCAFLAPQVVDVKVGEDIVQCCLSHTWHGARLWWKVIKSSLFWEGSRRSFMDKICLCSGLTQRTVMQHAVHWGSTGDQTSQERCLQVDCLDVSCLSFMIKKETDLVKKKQLKSDKQAMIQCFSQTQRKFGTIPVKTLPMYIC